MALILKPDIRFRPDRSPLKVWEHPVKGQRYYIGADAARGIEHGDFAAIVGWNGHTGEQAFRYASRISPEALAELLYLTGWYWNRAMISVELTGNLGLWAQVKLRDTYRYPNIYRWKGRDDRVPMQMASRVSLGWETNSRTRPMLLAAFRGGVKYGTCKVRDALILQQMEAAEMEAGRWEITIGHDDILLAAMIGWIAREQWYIAPPLGSTSKQLLGEEAKLSPEAEAKQAVPSAQLDDRGQAASHWAKLQAYIKRGGPAPKRLEGV